MSVFSVEAKGIKFNSASDIEPFLSQLHDNVSEIRLSGNTFGVDASIALASALRNKSSLASAQMADIFTGRLREEIPAALEALLPALQTCDALETVNLCDNAFGPTAASPLESFFAAHGGLKHLYLQNNGMGPEGGARMARALSANQGRQLETLICGRNRLENGSVAAWIDCVGAHAQTLKVLKMPQNGIRPEGIELLLRDGVSKCKSLQVLDMQDNTFTQRGSVALANALQQWPQLQELAVGDCLLSARGGRVLADALARGNNKELKILRLQYNEIDATGLKALKTAIELGLPKLETLELNGNKFSEDDESLDAIRTIFEERSLGEMDELDDLEEEDSDADENDDEQSNDEDEAEVVREADAAESAEPAETKTTNLSPLDAAIEKNLAAALNASSLTS